MTDYAFPRASAQGGITPAEAPFWNRQRNSRMPSHRYADAYSRVEVPLTEREWPTKRLTAAPLWVPVDLRDGNQALVEPMDPMRKRRFFELMVAMGYKEIEVGYPSSSAVVATCWSSPVTCRTCGSSSRPRCSTSPNPTMCSKSATR